MLVRCVESILGSVEKNSTTVVIVDNASSDGSIADLVQRFPDVVILRNAENYGYAKGNNIGARYLIENGCGLLLFVNPDVSFAADCIGRFVKTLEASSQAGCCFGLPLTKGRVSRMSVRTRPTPPQKWILYGPLNHVPTLYKRASTHFVPPGSLADGDEIYTGSGAMVLFRTIAFVEIDGFDEATFLYEEELICAERLKDRGWKTVFSKQARYSHVNGGSTQKIAYRRLLYFVKSEQYLLKNYYRWGWFTRNFLRLARYGEWVIECVRVFLLRRLPAKWIDEPQVNHSAT